MSAALYGTDVGFFHIVVALRVLWITEMCFAPKVRMDTRSSGNSKKKKEGQFAKIANLQLFIGIIWLIRTELCGSFTK